MLIAGPVVCRESAGARAKSNMFLFSSTMSCFQGEHWSVEGVVSELSHGAVHVNTFPKRAELFFFFLIYANRSQRRAGNTVAWRNT